MAVINKNGTYMALPSGIKRGNPVALDTTSVWYSREEMEQYAQSSLVAYVGQVLTLVDEASSTSTVYVIADTAGTLKEVGSDASSLEGLQTDLEALQSIVTGEEGLATQVNDLNELLYGVEEAVENQGLLAQVEAIDLDLTNLEDGVADLTAEVNTLSQNLANNYYDKTAIDGRLSGVFHFKGSVDSYEALPSENVAEGDVYQIGDKEYAWNGTEWVELGYVVDLSSYYNKDDIDGKFTAVDGKITALEQADANFTAKFVTVEGDINTLKGYVGAPSEGSNLGALYPAVESLNSRLNDIVAEGGEPNQINGISINGVQLTANDALIVELPVFAGETAGLVPVVSDEIKNNPTNYVLNAAAEWVNPFGDIGDQTVKDYVDAAIAEVAIMWDTI